MLIINIVSMIAKYLYEDSHFQIYSPFRPHSHKHSVHQIKKRIKMALKKSHELPKVQKKDYLASREEGHNGTNYQNPGCCGTYYINRLWRRP